MEKLANCPYCRSANVKIGYSGSDAVRADAVVVYCTSCNASGPLYWYGRGRKDKSIRDASRRAAADWGRISTSVAMSATSASCGVDRKPCPYCKSEDVKVFRNVTEAGRIVQPVCLTCFAAGHSLTFARDIESWGAINLVMDNWDSVSVAVYGDGV